jgi:hypothetical protein
VGDIEKSCNANNACESAGSDVLNKNYEVENYLSPGVRYDGDGPILSNLNSCCNLAAACKLANQTKLPTNSGVASRARLVRF